MSDSVARILMMSALEAGQLGEQVVVQEDIGGIPAGKVYAADTPLAAIIKELLGPQPSTQVTIYYGGLDSTPTSVVGLTSKTVQSSDLVGEYSQHISAGNPTTKKAQYVVFAIPTAYTVEKWCAAGFPYDIPHTLVVNGGYNIYYLNNKSYDEDEGGINYVITIDD